VELPKGFDMKDSKCGRKDYVLKPHCNICGQKQAGRAWNECSVDKLINKVGFTQSNVDDCVFHKGSVVCLLHTDDSIFAGPDQPEIDQVIADM